MTTRRTFLVTSGVGVGGLLTVIASGEIRPGVRTPAVWRVSGTPLP